jgi:hypothetical protein
MHSFCAPAVALSIMLVIGCQAPKESGDPVVHCWINNVQEYTSTQEYTCCKPTITTVSDGIVEVPVELKSATVQVEPTRIEVPTTNYTASTATVYEEGKIESERITGIQKVDAQKLFTALQFAIAELGYDVESSNVQPSTVTVTAQPKTVYLDADRTKNIKVRHRIIARIIPERPGTAELIRFNVYSQDVTTGKKLDISIPEKLFVNLETELTKVRP